MKKDWALRWFAIINTAGMFLVLFAGTLVSTTGSGDGCGRTWPLCHGEFRPLASLPSLIEYGHRAVSGVVGIMITVLAIWVWLRFRGQRRDVQALAWSGFGFTFLQAILGAMAVIWEQSATVLALHFGISLLAFASVLLLSLRLYQDPDTFQNLPPVARGLRNGIWLLTLYIYAAIYSGALVRHTDASAGCTGWPLCNGSLLPSDLTGVTGIQFFHRSAAALGLLLVLALFSAVWRVRRARPDLHWSAFFVLLFMIALQLSGGYMVLSNFSLNSMMLHGVLISWLFGALAYMCIQTPLGKSSKSSKIGTWDA